MDFDEKATGPNKAAEAHRVQAVFGAAIRVVKHGVASPQHHVYALAHGHRLEHLHHLFVGPSQHAGLIDVD